MTLEEGRLRRRIERLTKENKRLRAYLSFLEDRFDRDVSAYEDWIESRAEYYERS